MGGYYGQGMNQPGQPNGSQAPNGGQVPMGGYYGQGMNQPGQPSGSQTPNGGQVPNGGYYGQGMNQPEQPGQRQPQNSEHFSGQESRYGEQTQGRNGTQDEQTGV